MKKIQLTIPEPCHENWDKMTPQDKGRFCAACQKTVVDFTNMSDREIAEFFKKPPSSVCGHFNQDQLERDISIARKRIPWIRYFFQFSLPALLISAKATAQGAVEFKGKTVCKPDSAGRSTILPLQANEKKILEGKVIDNHGYPVPGASVMIRGTENGVATSDSGTFRIMTEPNVTLVVSSIGYNLTAVVVRDFSAKTIMLERSSAMLEGFVIVKTTSRKKKKEPIPIVAKIIDTAFKNFKVFPNPARNNSNLKIDCSKLESGEYVLSVIDMSGEVLQTQEIFVDEKKKVIDFYLEEAKAGTYIIHLFNRRSTASFSEKIIVQ
jgi:hypothetical protein